MTVNIFHVDCTTNNIVGYLRDPSVSDRQWFASWWSTPCRASSGVTSRAPLWHGRLCRTCYRGSSRLRWCRICRPLYTVIRLLVQLCGSFLFSFSVQLASDSLDHRLLSSSCLCRCRHLHVTLAGVFAVETWTASRPRPSDNHTGDLSVYDREQSDEALKTEIACRYVIAVSYAAWLGH